MLSLREVTCQVGNNNSLMALVQGQMKLAVEEVNKPKFQYRIISLMPNHRMHLSSEARKCSPNFSKPPQTRWMILIWKVKLHTRWEYRVRQIQELERKWVIRKTLRIWITITGTNSNIRLKLWSFQKSTHSTQHFQALLISVSQILVTHSYKQLLATSWLVVSKVC
jgi:hypothetical protein